MRGRWILFFLFTFYTGYLSAQAPVPVIKEPRHHLALENKYVRLIDVHIPPGDTTLYHIHAAPSIIVILSSSVVGSALMNGKPSSGPVTPGATSFAAYKEHPITHHVWNEGKNMYHVMDIEWVEHDTASGVFPEYHQEGFHLNWEEHGVRSYTLNTTQNDSIRINGNAYAHLLIGVRSTARLRVAQEHAVYKKELSAGQFLFFQPGTSVNIQGQAEIVMLELK